MLNHPRFKPHLRVEVVPGEGAFVLSGTQQTLLKGKLYEHVVPAVTGCPADEICEQLQSQLSAAEVYFVLAQLEKKGYLCEEDPSLSAAEAALWSAQQIDPAEAARRLASATVSVRSFGVDASAFHELLGALRVRVEEEGELEVVVADGYLRTELAEINAEALRRGKPWLLVRPVGRELWIGPLFRPGITGCWECLAHRVRANRPVESYLASRNGHANQGHAAAPAGPGPIEVAASPATQQAAFGLAANAVATWIVRGELPSLEGKVQTFDVSTWQSKSHTLVRLPYCPACGTTGSAREPVLRPLVLEKRAKSFTSDGGHRVVAPEVTLERFGHHVSPITGAVTMLERVVPAGDGAMHVYIAGHNLARRHRTLDHLRGDLRNMSSGKGATDIQARASGLCEGLERYSGVFRGDEPRRKARFRELGEVAIHPHTCLLFSDRQYREREAWNARESHYNFVPFPFDPDAEIEWTAVWSLTRGEPRYLPTAYCYFDYPYEANRPFCLACSNGSAAGNTKEEAVLQGFLELVERDSVALWWYNRVRRPAVDLDAFGEPYFEKVRESLRGRGREMWAIDVTSDLGVPVFAAISRATSRPEERIVLGFGAHLDARVALLRAVTELNQMLANLPQESDEGALADKVTDRETLHWLQTATLANQPYLVPDPDAKARALADFRRDWADDVAEDVQACQALVERLGLEMMVLDQTRPEIGLPVAKVIVPGLRHFWARFAPGRLYDVPVQLGWIPRPLPEEDLNPIPMFL